MNLSELTEWPAVVQTPWLTQAAGGGGTHGQERGPFPLPRCVATKASLGQNAA